YPFFYTKENALGQVLGYLPTLEMRVQVGDLADWNGDATVDIFDVLAFLADFDAQSPDADFNGDCSFDIFDILEYLGHL
ncbi:MAG: hypothetical protein KDA28_12855, partial [Phycisphaerales bacterium]|nr:hypothetical protein [Phycisphaerales bacterium]